MQSTLQERPRKALPYRQRTSFEWRWPVILACAGFLLHLAGSGHYGFFRDELYYIACGDRLAWGYVDQPPLVALLARLGGFLFGHTLAGYRILPALASSGTVLV